MTSTDNNKAIVSSHIIYATVTVVLILIVIWTLDRLKNVKKTQDLLQKQFKAGHINPIEMNQAIEFHTNQAIQNYQANHPPQQIYVAQKEQEVKGEALMDETVQ